MARMWDEKIIRVNRALEPPCVFTWCVSLTQDTCQDHRHWVQRWELFTSPTDNPQVSYSTSPPWKRCKCYGEILKKYVVWKFRQHISKRVLVLVEDTNLMQAFTKSGVTSAPTSISAQVAFCFGSIMKHFFIHLGRQDSSSSRFKLHLFSCSKLM